MWARFGAWGVWRAARGEACACFLRVLVLFVREACVADGLLKILPAAAVEGLFEVKEDEERIYVLLFGVGLEELQQENVFYNKAAGNETVLWSG